jgi:hypothetical protein
VWTCRYLKTVLEKHAASIFRVENAGSMFLPKEIYLVENNKQIETAKR